MENSPTAPNIPGLRVRAIAVGTIRCYQWVLSPFLHHALFFPGGCRFSPTCSAYGLAAVRQYGLPIGFMLSLTRLARCHPWARGGYDPVPMCAGRSVASWGERRTRADGARA